MSFMLAVVRATLVWKLDVRREEHREASQSGEMTWLISLKPQVVT